MKVTNKKEDLEFLDHLNEETRLWTIFLRAAYNIPFEPRAVAPDVIANHIDNCGLFLETQITAVKALDKKGNEISVTTNDAGDLTFSSEPARVIAYRNHVEIEYSEQGADEKFEARGFKFDYTKEDEIELALRERASAALVLVSAAKANGWDKIDFGDTSDPVERFFLVKACKAIGMDFDDKIYSSSVNEGLDILSNIPTKGPLAPSDALLKAWQGGQLGDEEFGTMLENFEAKLLMRWELYLDSYAEPLCEGDNRPSPSPSYKPPSGGVTGDSPGGTTPF